MLRLRFRRIPFAAALVALCTLSTLASAEGESLLDLPLEKLLNIEITTASKRKERLSRAPGTAYVITRREIRSRGYTYLIDVLRDLPGMEIVEQYFSEIGTLVPVRGVVGNNKIVVMVNGSRVNPPGGEEMMLRHDFSIRAAEQIEVIYGPGSTLYGQDAISLVINVITRQVESGVEGEASVAAGNHDTREGFAYIAGRGTGDDALKFSAYASYKQSELTDLSSEYPEWWSNYEEVLRPTGRDTEPQRPSDALNMLLRAENSSSSVQLWYRDSKRSSAEGSYTPILQYVEEAIWHDRSMAIEGRTTFSLSEAAQLESRLSYNWYEIDPETRYVFPVAADTLFLDDYKYGEGSGVTLEEKLDWRLSSDLDLTFGVAVSQFDVIPKATIPGRADPDGDIVSQGGSFAYYTIAGDPSSRVEVARATDLNYQNYSAYVEANYRFNEDLTLVGGVRLDDNTRFDDRPFSPRAALIYTHQPSSLTFKYGFSKAYVAPAPYYGYNVFDNGRALNTANPELEPERATSNEISVSWQGDRLLLSAAAYYNEQSNLLLLGDLGLPANIIDDEVYLDEAGTVTRILTSTANGGESRATGFDLVARYQSERWSGWSSYSYVDYSSEIGDLSTGLAQISQHNIRAGITVELLDGLYITPSLILRSTPQNITQTFSLDEEVRTPYELNLHMLYAPSEQFELFMIMRNVTDHHYALRGLLGPIPQETLNFRFGARVIF